MPGAALIKCVSMQRYTMPSTASRADPLAQNIGQPLWPAAKVEAAPALRNTNAIKKDICVSCPHIVLEAQPFELLRLHAFDWIAAGAFADLCHRIAFAI